MDNDNFELNKGAYDTVRFTVWNAPASFYAGIQDLFTLPSNSDVIITTKIANGTVNTGDQLLVNEISKIITVKKIEKGIGTSAIVVETATPIVPLIRLSFRSNMQKEKEPYPQ